jgi:hypothetical protein
MRMGWLQSLSLAGVLMGAAGCISPATTRAPDPVMGHPVLERRAYERHDPFPDSFAGPDMMNRPRGFVHQRTEPRRAAEDRMLLSVPLAPGQPIPTLPPIGTRYPHVVHP